MGWGVSLYKKASPKSFSIYQKGEPSWKKKRF
jgi:hypothetical protein